MSTFKENLQLWAKRMTSKYRLILMNENTFEERISFQLSPANVYILLSVGFIFFSVLMFVLIAFTPIKQYIPGYGDFDTQSKVIQQKKQIETLEKQVKYHQLFISNLQNVLTNKKDTTALVSMKDIEKGKVDLNKNITEEDKELRAEVERDKEKNSYVIDKKTNVVSSKNNSSFIRFIAPVTGYTTEEFDLNKEHYGIDIVTKKDELVKCAMDGFVISSGWNAENGNTIVLQHNDNFVTIYKHNSKLLKKTGDFIRVGEAIAIVGNTGELSNGPHLHFEIWHNGTPINPRNYIDLR